MIITKKGICCQGFKANGIKKGKYGVAIILSEAAANCALMITSNRIKAAPLLVSQEHFSRREIFGIVANSGNANAYTGRKGIEDAKKMCKLAAKELDLKPENFFVASTGVIGRRMDVTAVEEGIKKAAKNLKSSSEASLKAAKAILTTDRFPKLVSVRARLKSGEEIEIGGIAKGAGMIAPQLKHATLMCFLTTNAYVPKDKIKDILESAVEQSFNATIVDGDTSTNDIAALLANGLAGNEDLDENFQGALNYVARELAKMIAKDGEGATKLLEITVQNARSRKDAVKAARAIARSNLVKTAFFGCDPNWGRIIAALGYSGAKFNPEKLSLFFEAGNNKACLIDRGKVLAYQGAKELKAAEKILKAREIKVIVDLHSGRESATVFGCDLTHDYVKINATYTS
ncbi:MAG: bifunctional ornithine acetyltransferase/N-acetylglutamate synthase [Euryarchaeota archaeon]|nr:bifunctional ornithine acetyltransferase/N-acetylglutamate synthase [Euryarchaeota archaeon]